MTETWINIILNIIIILSLLIGTFFIVSSSIGIIRFPDIYTRLHAATKASTLGLAAILIGAFLFLYIENNIISGKLILSIIFILLTAPVSGHMISRAAHKTGVKPVINNQQDELAKAEKQFYVEKVK
ncbi:monovalent cation/H(+) antiporter subunit G [Paracerasibacillus soli]|uniref:Monovalent cation/H(+) antiporter subunit G n=2 Tax=Paracerasibacillus soli TaxID=480284 RepID=A0ABU5CQ81_9BACI|nr:monovalent cation/H(+) antiporter subunit G [Virgibacillus soli]MDY0408514.1 monovalent cation/H(+) antiporter subunit G [Virgibacillus soli]